MALKKRQTWYSGWLAGLHDATRSRITMPGKCMESFKTGARWWRGNRPAIAAIRYHGDHDMCCPWGC